MALRKNEAKWVESRQRWQINVTNDDGVRKTFVSSKAGRKGKLEAERKADGWLENSTLSSDVRIARLYERYLEHLQSKGVGRSHLQPCQSIGKTWIIPIIGNKKLNKLTEVDIERVLFAARDAGRSQKYLKNIRACISAMLKYARKQKLTDFSPEDISMPKGGKKSNKTSLEPDEIKVIFSSSETSWRGKPIEDIYVHAYRLQILTGLRPGEIIGLRVSDIEQDILTVSQSINKYGEITEGKNENAQRCIQLSPYALEVVAAQRKALMRRQLLSPYLFPDEYGAAVRQETYREAWRRYCQHNHIGGRGTTASGAPRYITPYELRHTCDSVNKDMPTALKKLVFGHSESFDGDATYSHKIAGDLEAAAKYTQAAFARILE